MWDLLEKQSCEEEEVLQFFVKFVYDLKKIVRFLGDSVVERIKCIYSEDICVVCV